MKRYIELNYPRGRGAMARELGITITEVDAFASDRIKEYWNLYEATSTQDKFIEAFERLCSEFSLTPVSAANRLKKHYKK